MCVWRTSTPGARSPSMSRESSTSWTLAVLRERLEYALELQGLREDSLGGDRACAAFAGRRDYHDRNRRPARIVLLPAAELPPVHDRHHQVEEDDAGGLARVEVDESLLAVRRRHNAVAFVFQELAKGVSDVAVVVDHQHDSWGRWAHGRIRNLPGRFSMAACTYNRTLVGPLRARRGAPARARGSLVFFLRGEFVEKCAKLRVPRTRVVATELDETRRKLAVEQDVRQEVGFAGAFPLADAPHDLADHPICPARELR